MRQKWEWIDVLKGVGILSVAYSHLYGGYLRDLLFIFHMPLFFLIGGFLYRPQPQLGGYLRKKAQHLLLPYASFLVLLSLPMLYQAFVDSGRTWSETSALSRDMLLGGRALTAWLAVFWFVTCFFAVQQITNWLVTRLSPGKVRWTMVALAMAAYAQQFYWRDLWLPGNLDVVAMAAPFYYLGYEIKQREIDWERGWPLAAVAFFAAAGCLALALSDLSKVDMKYALYGIPVFSFCAAVALTGISASLARRLADIGLLRRMLGYLGRSSMTVMYLHVPLIYFFRHPLGLEKSPWIFALAIMIPLLAHRLILLTALTRGLFLGSSQDLRAVWSGRDGRPVTG